MPDPTLNRSMIQLAISVSPELHFLLKPAWRESDPISITLTRKASIKDVVESLGIPHTEIGALIVNDENVRFNHLVQNNDRLTVMPVRPPVDVNRPTLLRPHPFESARFIVDVNVGRLARLLRLLGFDTDYNPEWGDHELAQRSYADQRILLTRDRSLLRFACVEFGHLVRSSQPEQQLVEVLKLYGLSPKIKPFTRCITCNGTLKNVRKDEIEYRLEPLTRKYYEVFQKCQQCHQIFWDGSHKKGMKTLISRVLLSLEGEP